MLVRRRGSDVTDPFRRTWMFTANSAATRTHTNKIKTNGKVTLLSGKKNNNNFYRFIGQIVISKTVFLMYVE